jgi:hypothetical protein
MKIKSQNLWRWWAKAIGEKASKCDRESDAVAMIRSVIFVTYLITNCFIIAGVIRHWNDEVPSNLSQAEKEKIIKANRSFLYD